MVANTHNLMDNTDRDLEQRVRTFLATRQHAAFRALSIEAHRGVVTLRGQVSSFYEKQLSFLLSSRVAGVTRLIDEIAVTPERGPLQSLLFPQDATL